MCCGCCRTQQQFHSSFIHHLDLDELLGDPFDQLYRHTRPAMPSCHPHTLAYHSFTDADVVAIRSHLLAWYRANRRRLPWRGDAPPYGAAAKQRQPQLPRNNHSNNTTSSPSTNTLSRFFTTLPTTTPLTPSTNGYRPQPSPPPSPPTSADLSTTSQPPERVSAYGVWVSEVMLQQTRVEAVINHYMRWMTRFPTLAALAAASADDVNSAWSGLGYYRRARLLHEAAKHVQSTLQGRLPDTVSGLLDIAGIGPYTAGAIASIAYNKPVPLVDGNVSRVLSRLRALHASPRQPTALALHWQLAQQLATGSSGSSGQATDASDWSQALMELGAVVCMPRVAECGRCPVRQWCRAAEEVAERQRPVGDATWRVSRKRVEVEVEMDENEVQDGRTRTTTSAVTEEEKEVHEVVKIQTTNSIGRPKRRSAQGKQSNRKARAVVLDNSLCSICDAQTAAPTTVLEYPSKVDKKPPTDEHVSVCVMSRQRVRCEGGSEVEWLLVQRPAAGLLAGQWEFPAVVHPPPTSASSSSTARPPTAAQRRQLLTSGLASLLPASLTALIASSACQSVGELTHVFSHRRHLMHVQRCTVELQAADDEDAEIEGESSDGRRWRWMTESEISATGLTSGQRKVWKLSRAATVRVAAGSGKTAVTRKRKEIAVQEEDKEEDGEAEREEGVDVDESRDGDGNGEQGGDEEAGEEEWEVWPAAALHSEAVEQADGVIVID